MNKNNRNAKLAAIAILPALGIATFAGSVFAASATTTTTPARSFMGMRHGLRDNTTFASNLASVLGLTATEVKAKLDAGQTPLDIITAAGKMQADVQTALQALQLTSLKTTLAADVSSGKITQAEADAMLARHETNKGKGGGHRGGGLFHGMMRTNGILPNSTQ